MCLCSFLILPHNAPKHTTNTAIQYSAHDPTTLIRSFTKQTIVECFAPSPPPYVQYAPTLCPCSGVYGSQKNTPLSLFCGFYGYHTPPLSLCLDFVRSSLTLPLTFSFNMYTTKTHRSKDVIVKDHNDLWAPIINGLKDLTGTPHYLSLSFAFLRASFTIFSVLFLTGCGKRCEGGKNNIQSEIRGG